jgi:hypothetical protein
MFTVLTRKRDPVQLDTTLGDTFETFLTRLNEAITWHGNFSGHQTDRPSWRSSTLKPWWWAGGRKAIVEHVAFKRHMRLPQIISSANLTLASGRLLLYFPDLNTSDTMAESETRGFFDSDNNPPWDMWVAYFYESSGKNYLISWIPPEFVELASKGVEVNPEQCISWVDPHEVLAVSKLVKEKGLA